jgi:hypothetical protein
MKLKAGYKKRERMFLKTQENAVLKRELLPLLI